MFALISAHSNADAGTTAADFLKWEKNAQVSFFQITISMLGTVATQVRPEMASCIDDWYFIDEAKQEERHAEMLDVMRDYAEFDATAFMLGYVESVCGKMHAD